jgi:hypothetical protein
LERPVGWHYSGDEAEQLVGKASTSMKRLILSIACVAVVACQPRGTLSFSTPLHDQVGRYTINVNGKTKLVIEQDASGTVRTTLENGEQREYPLPIFVPHGAHRVSIEKNGKVIRDELVTVDHERPEVYFAIDEIRSTTH